MSREVGRGKKDKGSRKKEVKRGDGGERERKEGQRKNKDRRGLREIIRK